MSKIGVVAKFEIVRQLKKPSFWIALLMLPLGIFAIIAQQTRTGEGQKSAIVSDVSTEENDTEESKNEKLNVCFELPQDFAENLTNDISQTSDSADYDSSIANLIKTNIDENLSLEEQVAILDSMQNSAVVLDEWSEKGSSLGEAIIPIIVLVIFYVLICVFGNRLLTALTEEKENRISEMILTAVSARDLVIGKIISLITLGFIQIVTFSIPIIIMLVICRNEPIVASALKMISLDPWSLISSIILLVVSYLFYAGTCTLVSSLAPTARDASNYAAVIIFGMVLPIFFITEFVSATPNLITYILSYFPLLSPPTLMLRNAFGTLPVWEFVLGVVELSVCSAGVMALTVKSFQKNAINFSTIKPNFGFKKLKRGHK